MAEFRLPGGYVSALENDIIQKGSGGLWYSRGPGEMVIPGRLLLRSIFESGASTVFNLNARTTKFRVYGQGPGGGGGGVNGEGNGTAAVGAAGQAGGYFDHIFTRTNASSFEFTVGQGGGGGNTGAGLNGNPGSSATFVVYDGVTVGALAGLGGFGFIAITPVATFILSPTDGSALLGSPDFGISQRAGSFGFVFPTGSGDAVVASGLGGSSVLARGGAPVTVSSGNANGKDGVHGGGGSGAVVSQNTGEPDGGDGGNGVLFVEEYS